MLSVRVGLVVCILICFSGISGHGLWTPDEPRVAAISLEMAEAHDIIVPRLSGEPFVEKPPLYFGVSALMLRLLGPVVGDVTALRLTAALFGAGVLVLTFGIGTRLFGRSSGFGAALILATMEGFVENFHWIRVDAALAFFVLAAVFLTLEAEGRNRPWLLSAAGLCTGCAFLSKGFVGPVLVAIPVLGLVLVSKLKSGDGLFQDGHWLPHWGLFLVSAAAVGGLWALPFYLSAGGGLWHEWFWVNHAGRFTGSAAKAHMIPGKPFYYIIQAVLYGVPWVPWMVFWGVRQGIKAARKRTATWETVFLFLWGAGSVVVLTLSTTKRGIYLLPVLPVFAIMAARGVAMMEESDRAGRWFRGYASFWTHLCLSLLIVIALLPVLARIPSGLIPVDAREAIVHAGFLNAVSLACLLVGVSVAVGFGRHFSGPSRVILASAALYVSLFGLPARAVDSVKDMKSDVKAFVATIPETMRSQVAGTGFSETMRACFYYYCGWKVPRIEDPERIRAVLEGRDPQYRAVIVNSRRIEDPATDLVNFSYTLVQRSIAGMDRGLFLIQGPGIPLIADLSCAPGQSLEPAARIR